MAVDCVFEAEAAAAAAHLEIPRAPIEANFKRTMYAVRPHILPLNGMYAYIH